MLKKWACLLYACMVVYDWVYIFFYIKGSEKIWGKLLYKSSSSTIINRQSMAIHHQSSIHKSIHQSSSSSYERGNNTLYLPFPIQIPLLEQFLGENKPRIRKSGCSWGPSVIQRVTFVNSWCMHVKRRLSTAVVVHPVSPETCFRDHKRSQFIARVHVR